MNEALFEVIFMMVILKIPIVYLCLVVWYAIRAEPRPLEGAPRAVEPIEPGPRPWPLRRLMPRGPSRPRPHGGPIRTYARREAVARARLARR